MRVASGKPSNERNIICPFCESGRLLRVGPSFARCDSCALPLLGSMQETLRDIVRLPDVLGAHACECGHPEMRELADCVYHCPACRSEVLPTRASRTSRERHPAWSMSGETYIRAGGTDTR
jgi:ribosomal protein L37AE/L43A